MWIGLVIDVLPPLGWLLGVGYRLRVVRTGFTGPLPKVRPIGPLLFDGLVTAVVASLYCAPGLASGLAFFLRPSPALVPITGLLLIAGIFYVPAAMVRYLSKGHIAAAFELPLLTKQIRQHARGYLVAWAAVLPATVIVLLMIPLGYLLFGPAALWSWLVAGEAFEDALNEATLRPETKPP